MKFVLVNGNSTLIDQLNIVLFYKQTKNDIKTITADWRVYALAIPDSPGIPAACGL